MQDLCRYLPFTLLPIFILHQNSTDRALPGEDIQVSSIQAKLKLNESLKRSHLATFPQLSIHRELR